MAASESGAGFEGTPRNEPAAPASKLDSLMRRMSPLGRLFPDAAFVIVVTGMFTLGAVLIILYVVATAGPHLRYISVGLLTAFAAFLIGSLVGLVLGIPHVDSSRTSALGGNQLPSQQPEGPGQARDEAMLAKAMGQPGQEQTGAPASSQTNRPAARAIQADDATPRLLPNTNLAEISDWLTKLLLGAGLVSLTHLGKPLSELIDNVARGLGGATPTGGVTESAVVVAGTILITYVALGFLGGYLTTTLWYGKRLQRK